MTVPGCREVGIDQASVDLYWLPLGAGDAGRCVRGSGRLYEAVAAKQHHRARSDLYHSALIVQVDGHAFAIEMGPVWATSAPDRGVVAEGPVGMPSWGRARLFRYETRCWRDGTIPDLPAAVDSPQSRQHRRKQSPPSARLGRLLPQRNLGPGRAGGRRDVELELLDRLAALTQRSRPCRARSPATCMWSSTGMVRWTHRRRASKCSAAVH